MNFSFKSSNTITSISLLFLITFFHQSLSAQQLAFPTALGAGAYTTGGRDGIVTHVTNLNDSGPGSFREAMLLSVPRTIVFDVSGVIKLKSILALNSKNSDFTIAGQTAPEGGITIDGARVYFSSVDNAIIRHIRFKGGKDETYPVSYGNDSFTTTGSITSQIYDHVTFSFGVDEAADWQGQADNSVTNLTIQRSFFAESTKGTIIGKQYKLGAPVGDVSFLYNLFYNTGYRTPNIIGDKMNYDVINNVAINSGGRLVNSFGETNLNHIGNYYDYGNYSITDQNLNLHRFGTIPHIYTKGNKITGGNPQNTKLTNTVSQMNDNNKLSWKFHLALGGFAYGEQLPDNYFTDRQFPLKGKSFIPLSADLTHISVIKDVGCNSRLNEDGSVSRNFDILDEKWLDEVQSGIYPEKMKETDYIVPSIKSISRPANFYVNNPHIPEIWFAANVPAGQDHNDIAPSGYTWLEEYLNQVDGPSVIFAAKSVEVTPDKTELQISKTLQLSKSFTPTNATNQNGTWTSSDEDIAKVDANGVVTAISVGEVTITFTATDGGHKGQSEITVFPEALQASAGTDQNICHGASTTLTATGGTTYLWSTGETTAIIKVTPDATATYSVKAYDSTGKNSDTDDVTVTVNPLPTVDAGNNVTINSGESTTLTATGATSYEWSTGATTASITVTPKTTNTYTVTGTTNGCEVTDTVNITVSNSEKVVADAGGERNLCAGSSTTLTATGGATYLWSTGEKTAKITVIPSVTTIYTVTAYDSTGKNSDNADVKINVKPLPTVDAGNNITINSGESTTLTATGATTYEWSTGATGASITVSPTATKTYTVTGIKDGCEATDKVKVTVRNSVEIVAVAGADQNICKGSSATLSATGGATYLWSTGETTASIKVTPDVTTSYTVTAYDGTGKNSDTDDVKVSVNPLPAVDAGNNITINSGESTTLTATGATTYEWSTGATGASITVSPTATKTYTVTGIKDGCEATDKVKVTVRNSVEIVAVAGADQNICKGSSATLSATGGATYLWSTGDTTASIKVTPDVTTTYTVTAYDGTGKNSDTDDVKVSVNLLPTVDAGNNITINSGESTTLTATGATTYEWSTGATGASITVSPTATKTYTVRGIKNGCEATDKVTVTVNNTTKVVAKAGPDQNICNGSSTTLTATGGDTYLWSTGAKTKSIMVNPTTTAKYSVTAFVGDVSGTDEVVVYVDANPNVIIKNGSEATILEGEFITLSASGANSYKWSNGATKPNIAVSPRVTESFEVTGYVNNCAAQKSITVNVFEKVKANAGDDVTICRNDNTILTASGPDNTEYLWSTGETTKSITVDPKEDTEYSVMVYHALDSDTDNVIVKVENCKSAEQITEESVGLTDDSKKLEFLIHPNPTHGEVNIKVSGLTNLSSIHLYDLSGKSLYTETINEGDQQRYEKSLDLSDYASGIYLLRLVDNERVITKKVILR